MMLLTLNDLTRREKNKRHPDSREILLQNVDQRVRFDSFFCFQHM